MARSIGDGHRVIHGVAGSGKTMILGFRCLYLAQASSKPILVLCFNITLPEAAGNTGAAPVVKRFSSFKEEIEFAKSCIKKWHKNGSRRLSPDSCYKKS